MIKNPAKLVSTGAKIENGNVHVLLKFEGDMGFNFLVPPEAAMQLAEAVVANAAQITRDAPGMWEGQVAPFWPLQMDNCALAEAPDGNGVALVLAMGALRLGLVMRPDVVGKLEDGLRTFPEKAKALRGPLQ